MILRALARLVGLFLMLVVGWIVARVFRNAGRLASDRPGAPAPGPGGTSPPMVRDRVCNTFLPRSRALERTIGGQEHFFCSERCLQAFLERPVASRSV